MNIATLTSMFPVLLKGSIMTIELTVFSVLLGCFIGVIITMLEISKNRIISAVGFFYTWVFRGTPLLLQLFVFYYGLPSLGLTLTPLKAAIIGLSLNSGAYMAEIIRSGILAIDKGQFEASSALGFTYLQTMRKIILPQTIRIIIPTVGNEFISMIKDTSLVSSIAMEELMRHATLLVSATGNAVAPYFIAACLYLFLTTLFTTLFSSLERKLSVY